MERRGSRCCLFKKLRQKTDQQLVQLCVAGQETAWEALVDRYSRLVYHFPNDVRLSSADCEEVHQETFLALYRSLDKLSEVEALDQWLATVAKRITWKVVQRSRRSLEDIMPEHYDVEDPDDVADVVVSQKVAQSQIREAFSKLNDKCRKLLYLLFYEYDSAEYDRIAAEAGIARGSIGPVRKRCLVKLKKILEGMGIDEKSVSRFTS